MTDLIEKFKSLGASNAAIIEVVDIPFEPSLLDLCKMNTCGNYGRSWVCPPLSGEIDDLIATAKQYRQMLVFQAIYKLEDSFDIEGMFAANENFRKLTEDVDRVCRGAHCASVTKHPSADAATLFTKESFKVLSAGKCVLCSECGAITDEPCRNPDRAYAAIEAYGIYVSKLAELCGLNYINGVNTVTYFGGVLFN